MPLFNASNHNYVAAASPTSNASQNRVNRLKKQSQGKQKQEEEPSSKPASKPKMNSPHLNLLEKRRQLKERRKQAEAAKAEGGTPGRNKKKEFIQTRRANQQRILQTSNNNSNLTTDDPTSPPNYDNFDGDDETLVSVRRIVDQPNQQSGKQQSSGYNSLSDTMRQQQLQDIQKEQQRGTKTSNNSKYWLDEEKSEKVSRQTPGAADASSYLHASSSDYDKEEDSHLDVNPSSHSVDNGDKNSAGNNNYPYYSRTFPHNKGEPDDDRTYDYGSRDDADSFGSRGSYAARRQKEAERRRKALAEAQGLDNASKKSDGESPLINKEDFEHFKKTMDSPAMRIGMGVAGAATLGIVIGPVGLLVGAAVISIGFSVSHIPSEDRDRMQDSAKEKLQDLQEKACDVTEMVSNTCASTYKESGVADKVVENIPSQMVDNLPTCMTVTNVDDTVVDDNQQVVNQQQINNKNTATNNNSNPSTAVGINKKEGGDAAGKSRAIKNPFFMNKNKKVAVLQNVRIMPAGQIYGLDPATQPKAWLDVVASANTSHEEKQEAMEEILILAKDKRRARILLEEGILDYIMWTVSRYLEKVGGSDNPDWKNKEISNNEKDATRQAATCCMILGKAHCAAVHTEGDLQLMSLYERGIVPEERQVAQMLHEVPHHVRITNTSDPTIVDPSKEVFAFRELTLLQAEELARSVKAISRGII